MTCPKVGQHHSPPCPPRKGASSKPSTGIRHFVSGCSLAPGFKLLLLGPAPAWWTVPLNCDPERTLLSLRLLARCFVIARRGIVELATYTNINLFWESLTLSPVLGRNHMSPRLPQTQSSGSASQGLGLQACGTMPLSETPFKLGIPLARLALVGPTWDIQGFSIKS